MTKTDKKLCDKDMRALAARIRGTEWCARCEELNFRPGDELFLKVYANGVECVIWIDDNVIYANDGLPPIEGVKIVPFTETDRNKNRRFILNI